VQGDVQRAALRPRQRDRGAAAGGDHPGDGVEPQAVPRTGGDALMDTVAVPRRERAAPRAAEASPLLRRGPLHLAIVVICLIWMVPTIGLLVSSFRPPQLVSTTGWWTGLVPPFQFTLENYSRVLTTNNMAQSFVN